MASRALRSSAASVTDIRGTLIGMSKMLPSSSGGMYSSPIRRKSEAINPRTVRLANDSSCHFRPSMNATVRIVTNAKTIRYAVAQEMPSSAFSGNSPAPRISNTAKNQSTILRCGIAQLSTGL